MQRFFSPLWMLLKTASVQFASLIPAAVGYHLVGRFVYHTVPAWLPGCALSLALAAGLWVWYCRSSDYPVGWAIGTLAASTFLWFFFLIAVFRGTCVLHHYEGLRPLDAAVPVVAITLVFWLRHIMIRRNEHPPRMKRERV